MEMTAVLTEKAALKSTISAPKTQQNFPRCVQVSPGTRSLEMLGGIKTVILEKQN